MKILFAVVMTFIFCIGCIKNSVNGTVAPFFSTSDRGNNRVLIWFENPSFDQPADLVLGQSTFVGNSANGGGAIGQNTLSGPWGVATDGTHLVVADPGNNRILIWNSLPKSMNANADIVLGQSNFSSGALNQGGSASAATVGNVTAVFIYQNKLLVADNSNSRLLIWNSFPTQIDQPADLVLGQANFSSISVNQGGSPSAGTLYSPNAIAVVQNRLFVGDSGNGRILVWNSVPTQVDQPADLVLGQTNFISNSTNQGGSPSAVAMSGANSLFSDGQRLLAGDYGNHRVLIWNSLPTQMDQPADLVLGQPSFTTNTLAGTSTPSTIMYPSSITMDYNGGLYIGDEGPGRVAVWPSFPTQNNQAAASVLGQASLSGGSQNCGAANPTAQCMGNPWGLNNNYTLKGIKTPAGY